VITPLSYEHTDKLGPTLTHIATEKCGIIKSNSVCICAPQDKEAMKVIEDTCFERSTKLMLVGTDIKFEEVSSADDGQIFNISVPSEDYPGLKSRLIGSHQVVNAATAIGVIEALKARGEKIPRESVTTGIGLADWPGRLEVVKKRPYVVLDGAQNKASANVLAGAVKKIFKYKKLVLVLGVSKDKDISGILEELVPISDSIVLTKASIVSRAMDPHKIKGYIAAKDVHVALNVDDALKKAEETALKEDMVLVTGSLFVVGEARAYFSRKA
jgi:dihydrofolate synthase/folylpolyglutamate synthase